MKTTSLLLTLGTMLGFCLMASAQDAPQRPNGADRPQRPIPPEIIKKFDKDGDGKLSDDERKVMHEGMKAKMEERRKEMIAKYDTDGDGKLSDSEAAKAREERQAEMIKKFDKDGDGKLSEIERAAIPRDGGGRGGRGGPDRPGAGPGRPGAGPDRPVTPPVE